MKIGDGKKTWSEVKHLNISKNDKDKQIQNNFSNEQYSDASIYEVNSVVKGSLQNEIIEKNFQNPLLCVISLNEKKIAKRIFFLEDTLKLNLKKILYYLIF